MQELSIASNTQTWDGTIDVFDGRQIRGWLKGRGDDTPKIIDIYLNGVRTAMNCAANAFRSDLKDAGYSGGEYGFNYVLDSALDTSSFSEVTISVRLAGDGPEVLAKTFPGPFGAKPKPVKQSRLRCHVDSARIEDDFITFVGWAFDPSTPDRRIPIDFYLGDTQVGSAIACDLRADLRTAGIGDGAHGFIARLPVSVQGAFADLVAVVDGTLRINCAAVRIDTSSKPPTMVKRIEFLETPRIEGNKILIRGWTFEPKHKSHKARIEAQLGESRAYGFANQPCEDITHWKAHDGNCGFSIELPFTGDAPDLNALRIVHVDGSLAEIGPHTSGLIPMPEWPVPTSINDRFASGMMVRHDVLHGWVARMDNPAPIKVRVECDDQPVWSGLANRIEDVELSGRKKRGAHGFRVELPDPTSPVLFRKVSVYTEKNQHIPGSPIYYLYGDEYIGRIEHIQRAGNGHVIVQGWCLNQRRPSEAVPIHVTNHLGIVIAEGRAELRRPDLTDTGLDAPFGGFMIEVPLDQVKQGLFVKPANSLCVLINLPVALEDLEKISDAPSPASTAPVFADESNTIQGTVDVVSSEVIRGWARCIEDPSRTVFLDLFIDGALVSTTSARRFRADLAKKFNDHGCHEYMFELSSPMVWQRPGQIVVRPRRGGYQKFNKAAQELPLRAILATELSHGLSTFVRDRYTYASPTLAEAKIPLISCIVLNLNGAELLHRLFESFALYNTQNCELIIIDHASTDASEAVCKQWSERLSIRFINRGANYSFSDSNNYGARHASGDLLLFLNNDVRLCRDVLPEMADMFRDARIGALGIKLLDDTPLPDDEPNALDSVRISSHAVQHLGVHLGLRSGQFSLQPFETRYSSPWREATTATVEVPVVTGAFMACRKADFNAVGGYDERYYYGYEDVDLCLKIRQLGKQVLCANHLPALHLRAYSRLKMDASQNHARIRNYKILDERFGLQIRRSLAMDRFTQPGFWTNAVPKIAFVVTSTAPDTMAGDYFTALEMAHALAEDYPVRCFFIVHDSPDLADLRGLDVVIAMRDDFNPNAIKRHDPHLLKIAWVRNWFERFADRPFADQFDAVWTSSALAGEYMQGRLGRAVDVVPIGTNAKRFTQGERQSEFECDYCFTGSYWGLNREIIQMLDPAALPYEFAVFGQGWEKIPRLQPYARGAIPYARMPDIYASTKLVIDDANHVTKGWASVNSRVFDALAAGCLVVTNGSAGVRALFGDAFPTYDTPQELENLLHTYLTNEDLRQEKVRELQSLVLNRHTYNERAARAWKSITGLSSATRIAIKIGAPRRAVREEWGDYHFARGMQHALEKQGYLVRIDCIDEWTSEKSNADDVVIVLRGLTEYKPRGDQINLMWVISHPDRLSYGELADYDHVFVASLPFSDQLKEQLGGKVSPLLQCTDERYFHPAAEPMPSPAPVLFVGNSREQFRPIVRDAIANELDLHVYGSRWTGFIPQSYLKGEHVPNRELASHYRSAGAVLNDHWDTMRNYGFISNRLFDAAACGARIVSDPVAGIADIFEGLVEEYEQAGDLKRIIDRLDNEGTESRERRDAFARKVIEEHSFHARMRVVSQTIGNILVARAADRSLYNTFVPTVS